MEPAGGLSQLPAGERLTGYLGAHSAGIQTGDGTSAVVESSFPIAIATGPTSWTPVDLGLHEVGGGFQPTTPVVEATIPKRVSQGAELSQIGISIVPSSSTGSPLEGSEGVIQGASVFFGETATDSDTLMKPTTDGVDVSTVLRSEQSPRQLYFSIRVPQGARLEAIAGGPTVARITKEGATIALVASPAAVDAAGTPVPVTARVVGSMLELSVTAEPGEYQYPIMVDPETFETVQESIAPGAWEFVQAGGYTAGSDGGPPYSEYALYATHKGAFGSNDYGAWSLEAPGYTRIYMSKIKDGLTPSIEYCGEPCREETAGFMSAWFEVAHPGYEAQHLVELSGDPEKNEATICPAENCVASGGTPGNAERFEVASTESSSYLEANGFATEFGGSFSDITYLSQPAGDHSTVEYTNSPTVDGTTNVIAAHAWLSARSGAFEFTSKDGGLGVLETALEDEYSPGHWAPLHSRDYRGTSSCQEVQCSKEEHEAFTLNSLPYDSLPNGEDHIRVAARSAMDNTWSSEYGEGTATLNVDTEPPHTLWISSSSNQLYERDGVYELGETEVDIAAHASDGESGVPSSGIRSLALTVDGYPIGTPRGSCSPGPCTATGEWSINGAELGTGMHTITLVATDGADNVKEEHFQLRVYHAAPVAMGPGSVNPESGDFALESTDVDLSGGDGSLEVTRHFDSRNTYEAPESPLGPEWALSLGSLASLEVLPDNSVMVIGSQGLTHFEAKSGGGFEAPQGDQNLTLEYESSKAEYLLKDSKEGTVTRFTQPKGAKSWMPTVSETATKTDTTTDEYRTEEPEAGKVLVEPTLEVAPHPNVNCSTEGGCRELEFKYDEGASTATGENESEWGNYKGRLEEVIASLWSPTKHEAQQIPVARYEYDSRGRLRAVWDPRITPNLKTTYGYDSNNDVTAITPAGRETWALVYGTTTEDASIGRLIKATQAPASATLWNGKLPSNSVAPKVSGSPVVGFTLGVTEGTWANSPVAYGYQWEDCNAEGRACAVIPAATNPNYTVAAGDVGHTLVAVVTAINGGGSITATSTATTLAGAESSVTQDVDAANSLNAVSCMPSSTTCVISDNKGNAYYTTNVSATGTATWTSWAGPGASPSEAVECPTSSLCLLAAGSKAGSGGNMYYSTSLGGSWKEAFSPTYGVDAISCVSSHFCAEGQDEDYIRYATTPGSEEWYLENLGGSTAMKGVDCLSSSFCVVADASGKVHVATSAAQIESTEWTSTDVDGSTVLNGVACVSASSCVVVDNAGDILNLAIAGGGAATATKHDIDGSNHLTAVTCPETSVCVAVDAVGNVFVSKNGGETWTERYAIGHDLTSVSCASGAVCVATDTTGEVDAFSATTEKPVSAGAISPVAGSTVEYGVPLEGSGAPAQMGVKDEESEPEKWGQTDLPVYATSIFPPDEPQSWPASKYTRATTYYIDHEARTVNVATPAGGIATTEYDESNNVVRTLSADNRAKALSEANPKEAALRLDTKSVYGEGESVLLETTGPQHAVKLERGKGGGREEVQARNHVKYFYDEGAPSGESYGLVTKTTDGALTSGGEEFDVRTTTTAYGGQEGLGWKLREPTSTTTDPAGLDLTHTTEYNENGSVSETKAPEGTSELVFPPAFVKNVGSSGSGEGQFSGPTAVAPTASGSIWVADSGNARIEEVSASGTVERVIGWGVSDGKDTMEICTSKCQAGIAGDGGGQFNEPWGIAVSPTTGDVYVSEVGNDRIQEFLPTGGLIRSFGSSEHGGPLYEPVGITVDSTGNVWVTEWQMSTVKEYSESGTYMSEIATANGKAPGDLDEPTGVAVSEGDVFIVNRGDGHIEQFTTSGTYKGQFGSEGEGAGEFDDAASIAANPTTGTLEVSDAGYGKVVEFTPAGRYLTEFGWSGEGNGRLRGPAGIAINSTGTTYIANREDNDISEWQPPEAGGAHLIFSTQFGSKGSGSGQLNGPTQPAIDGHGNLWVADYENNRVQEFGPQGNFIAAYGTEGSGNGQLEGPTSVAVNQATEDVYVGSCGDGKIAEWTTSGEFVRSFGAAGSASGQLGCIYGLTVDPSGNVWVADNSNNRVAEYTATGTFVADYGSKGAGNLQFDEPAGIVAAGNDIYVTDSHNNRVEELSASGEFVRAFSGEGFTGGTLSGPVGISADAAGNLYVVDGGNKRVEEFSPTGGYLAIFGSYGTGEGQFEYPVGVAINAAGEMYVSDFDSGRIEKWTSDEKAMHDAETYYYTAGNEAPNRQCRKHPEWVNLPCMTRAVSQEEAPGMPALPQTTIKYNIWDEAETTEEVFENSWRTRTNTYDEAGRPLTSEITASAESPTGEVTPSPDKPLPKVTDTYNETTGALETESTTEGGTTETIKRVENKRGFLQSYTDSSGAKTTYSRDVDNRVTHVEDPEGEQEYEYGPSGTVARLWDSGADTFSATYDAEGNLATESYPNAMLATYTRNATGEATGIEYTKTSHCAHTCPETWFSETNTPSIHGESLTRTSTLASENYTYDQAGRLTEVQETPAGQGCTTRLYAWNEEGDRTTLTTRPPATEGKCATSGSGATFEHHTYDNGNRLTDPATSYEPLGNITSLPPADAGGGEAGTLTSEYYVDNQIRKQKQDGKTSEYLLDPEGRTRETKTPENTTVTSHYDGPGGALAWTKEENTIVRHIPGLGGELTALETIGHKAIIQLHDLQGNIVATAEDNTETTKLTSEYNSTEFGVPTSGTHPAYSWLGADGISSELPSGDVTQDGVTYVPLIGLSLQTAGVAPPIPQNSGAQLGVSQAPWVSELAGSGGAIGVAQAEEARHRLEAASHPAGTCNEEVEGCGPDPEHGENLSGCRIWGSWPSETHAEFGTPTAYGHASCTGFAQGFELEVAVQYVASGGLTGGSYEMVQHKKTTFVDLHSERTLEMGFGCSRGDSYRLWIWGRAFFHHTTYWDAEALDGRLWTCPGHIEDSGGGGAGDLEEGSYGDGPTNEDN